MCSVEWNAWKKPITAFEHESAAVCCSCIFQTYMTNSTQFGTVENILNDIIVLTLWHRI